MDMIERQLKSVFPDADGVTSRFRRPRVGPAGWSPRRSARVGHATRRSAARMCASGSRARA